MILILIFFLLVFAILLRKKSVAALLLFIQLISVAGTFFLGREMNIETDADLGWIFVIILLILLIVLPWSKYHNINAIEGIDPKKLKIITRVLISINFFVFLIFLISTIVVMTLVEDINEFKYSEGVSTKFFYSMMPYPIIYLNMSIFLYYTSYFLLPLHFYYLHKNKIWLAVICFILSLNIILYGLTFFSRAVVIQYLFLYLATFFMLKGVMSVKVKRMLRNIVLVFGGVALSYFLVVSQKRFEEDKKTSKVYSKTIPVNAFTQDPTIYGYLDYMSQGYLNGYEVLQKYTGEGFNGSLTFDSILNLVSTPNQTYDRIKYRQKIWPSKYSYSFNGYVAYTVYDYGIFGGILSGILYFFIIWKIRPRNNALKLKDLFLIVLLIQIPLMSIFYSQTGGIFIALILWVLLNIYLKFKVKIV
jgi:oligosaccharide repeat unit polymerase